MSPHLVGGGDILMICFQSVWMSYSIGFHDFEVVLAVCLVSVCLVSDGFRAFSPNPRFVI